MIDELTQDPTLAPYLAMAAHLQRIAGAKSALPLLVNHNLIVEI